MRKYFDEVAELVFLVGMLVLLVGNTLIRLVWLDQPFLEAAAALVVPAIVGALAGAAALLGVFYPLREMSRFLKFLGMFIPAFMVAIARATIFESDESNLTFVFLIPLCIALVTYCPETLRGQCTAVLGMAGVAIWFSALEGSAAGAILALATGVMVLVISVRRSSSDLAGRAWAWVSAALVIVAFVVLLNAEWCNLKEVLAEPRFYLWSETDEMQQATWRAVFLAKGWGNAQFGVYDTVYFKNQLWTLMLCKLGWVPTIHAMLAYGVILAAGVWLAIRRGDALAVSIMVMMVLQAVAYALYCFGIVDLLFPAELPFFGGTGANMMWVLLAMWTLLTKQVDGIDCEELMMIDFVV